MAELNINRKEIPVGGVGYYVEQKGMEYNVRFGVVEEHYTTEICMQLYETKDMRLINGIPIKEFITPTEWKKLPKNWTYNTELFELSFAEFDDEIKKKTYSPKNPDDILQAIADGVLVKVQDNDHAHIETEIDKHDGYRVRRNYPIGEWHRTYVSLPYSEVYKTFDEAYQKIEDMKAEWKRQAELSDYDWSVSLIDKNISRAIAFGYITEKKGEEIRNRILAMDDVEDIETRISEGSVQWKYWKNKRWNTME